MVRDGKLDVLKFFLIFCVVLGHCFGHYLKQIDIWGIYNFIYFFHMPLFVFLSGYFTKKMSLRCKKFWVSEFKLLETYFVFDFFHRLPSFLDGSFVFRDLIEPSWSLWYLVSLVYWRFMIQILTQFFSSWKSMLIITFLMSLASGLVPVAYGLSFQRTFFFLPFFVIGFLFARNNRIEKIRMMNHLPALFILIVSLTTCICYVDVDIHTIVWGAFPYSESGYAVIEAFLFRICYYLIGFLLAFSIINIFNFNNVFLAIEGQKTLLYYVYHTFLLLGVFALVQYIELPVNLILLVSLSFLVMVVIYFISKLNVFLFLVNPVSSVVKIVEENLRKC